MNEDGILGSKDHQSSRGCNNREGAEELEYQHAMFFFVFPDDHWLRSFIVNAVDQRAMEVEN